MKPDAEWKSKQRSIMLRQINTSDEDFDKNSLLGEIFSLPLNLAQNFSQPAVTVFLIVFLFLTGGFAGLRAAQDSKPGDSLYIAKIVGEKTQLALAFTDKKKVQLGLEFAVKRVEEMKQVIAEDEGMAADHKVKKLVKDFKKEISAAKLRIGKISNSSEINNTKDENKKEPINNEQNSKSEDNADSDGLEAADDQIFSAGSSKDDNGLQVLENKKTNSKEKIEVIKDSNDLELKLESTTTKEVKKSSTTEEVLTTKSESPESMLEQASKLLQAESYDTIFDILDEAGVVVDQTFDRGEVKGMEESINIEAGTSTEE